MASPAAMRVFAVPELLENILLEVKSNDHANGPSCLQLFTIQRVCRTFHAVIATSKSLQRNMHHITLIDKQPGIWITLPYLFVTLADKVSRADKYRTTFSQKPRGISWRGIRITYPSSKSFRVVKPIIFRHRESGTLYYEEFYYAESGRTALGTLVDWADAIEPRTMKEHLKARQLFLRNYRRT